MKTLLCFFLFLISSHAQVRLCEELKSGNVSAVICPQTLNTLIYLAPVSVDDVPGVMNLSLKSANPLTTGFRVSVRYYRSIYDAETSVITGYVDAASPGEYATLQLLTGRISGVKSIEVTEIPPPSQVITF